MMFSLGLIFMVLFFYLYYLFVGFRVKWFLCLVIDRGMEFRTLIDYHWLFLFFKKVLFG